MKRAMGIFWTAAAAVLASAGVSEAHVFGVGAGGFGAGFLHPLGGLDHVLAMLMVGLWAAQLGGGFVWKLPSVFIAMMAAGAALGSLGVPFPFVEMGVLASIFFLGGCIAAAWRNGSAGMALAGVFAVFHGYVHGAEVPLAAAYISYAAGFIAGTSALLAAGAALGATLNSVKAGRMLYRFTGASLAGAAAVMWIMGR